MISQSAVSPQSVIDEARSWIGTPYHHNARIKGAGVDCAQLIVGVYSAVGAIPQIDPQYPHQWHLHRDDERFVGWVLQFGIEVEAPSLGGIVLYRFGRAYSHGAIYIADAAIIHAAINQPVTVAKIDEGMLDSRPRRYFRLNALEV